VSNATASPCVKRLQRVAQPWSGPARGF